MRTSILIIVLLNCRSAFCSDSSNRSLLPINPYVLIGDNLTLTCTHCTEGNTSLVILYGQEDEGFPLEYITVVSPHVLRLDMPLKDETWDETMIICFDDLDYSFEEGQILEVEYPPRNMTNFTVLVDNWNTLDISWTIPRYLKNDNIKLDVEWTTLYYSYRWYNCSDGSSITNCFLDNDDYLDSPEYRFRINITNIKADVTHVQYVNIQSKHYVRTAPPEGLSANTSSRSLTATWDQIPYRPQIWAYTLHLDNMTIAKGEVDKDRVTIHNLRPDTVYNLSVSSKPLASFKWSLPSWITDRTVEDKPEAGVPVMEGGYHVISPCKDERRIIVIFLTTPARAKWNGNLTEFKISYTPSDEGKEIRHRIPETSLNDTVELSCAVAYKVEITLYNRVGPSPTSSLRIPVHGTVTRPRRVRVRISREVGQLEWIKGDSVRSQAVFWCQGTRLPFKCKGRTQWKSVPETDNTTSIKYAARNIYGVSITTDNGSSDIVWADCTYRLEKEPTRTPKVYSTDMPSPNTLAVRWNPKTCADNVLITHYIVEHCDINNNTGCVTSKVGSDDGVYSIPDLTAGVNYSVRLREVTVDGKMGEFSDHIYATPLSAGSKPQDENTWIFLVAAISIFGLIAIIAGLLRFRKTEFKEPIDMPISVIDPDSSTTKTSIPPLVHMENEVDTSQKASEMIIPKENRADSGYKSESSKEVQEDDDTGPSPEPDMKKQRVHGDSAGSNDCSPHKDNSASEWHGEEGEDTKEESDDSYSVVVGADEDQCGGDEDNLGEVRSDLHLGDPGILDTEDQSNSDVEERGYLDDID